MPVYGLGHYPDGRPFYAMRFIRGDSLKEAIARFHGADEQPGRDPGERTLALRQLLRRFVDVCNAVAYAHSRGVLHRDLKPGNVMLGPYGETLVVDWGLAKPIGRPEGAAPPTEGTLRALVGERPGADPDGLGDRHAGLHEPRAGGGPTGRAGPGQRRLQPGGDALQPADGPGAVHRRRARGRAAEGAGGRFPAAASGEPRGAAGAGGDLPQGDGEGTEAAATRRQRRWPTRSSTGWPTSRWLPGASRCRPWAALDATAPDAGGQCGGGGVFGLVGLAAVATVQAGKNRELESRMLSSRKSQELDQQRRTAEDQRNGPHGRASGLR